MSLFVWNDSYSVGNPTMDAQHKHLVQMLNTLHQAMAKGAANEILGTLLADLISYTRTHFALEEAVMQRSGFPQLAMHKQSHQRLMQEAAKLQQDFQDGRVALSLSVMTFLRDWLSNHILREDKQYTPWTKGERSLARA